MSLTSDQADPPVLAGFQPVARFERLGGCEGETRVVHARCGGRRDPMGDPASTGRVRPAVGLDEAGVPRLPRTYVPRNELWRRLDAAGDSAVVTLVAPAGAGKTLGVAGWLRNARAPASSGDVVWLDASVDSIFLRLAIPSARRKRPAR